MVYIRFWRTKIDFDRFLYFLIALFYNQFLSLELILGEVKIFYFLSESFSEELPNINHFTSKLILTKVIPTVLFRINSPNTH